MKRHRYSFIRWILPLLAVALGGAATRDTAPSPTIQRYIDALLKHRLKPEPLPIDPPNPFQMTSGARREPTPDELAMKPAVSEGIATPTLTGRDSTTKEAGGPSDSDVLVTCATKLKLGGIIVLKEQIQIVVNGVPRKEGDTVAADWNNTIVYLRITRLLPGQMVLHYGEAEATVKF